MPINRKSTIHTMERTHFIRFEAVLAEKDKTGVRLAEQMDRIIGTVSLRMTNKVQPSVKQFYDIAKHLDVEVRNLLLSSK